MKVTLIFSLILVSSLFINSAYAFPGFDNGWDFFKGLKRVSQNFVETITIDPKQKQQVILKNLAGWQAEKEQLVKDNKPVPKEYDEIIDSKKESLKQIDDESTSALSSITDTILVGQELGKIQTYVDRFHELKEGNQNDANRSQEIRDLESDVNKLNLVKKHCQPISVNVLLSVEEPYDSIIKFCPVLKSIPKTLVMSTLNGD